MAQVKYPSIDNLSMNSSRSWAGDAPGEEGNVNWYIEEKIDGSQLTFRLRHEGDADYNAEAPSLLFFNKGGNVGSTSKVFVKAINLLNTVCDRFNPSYVYHGEAVCSTQHNVVKYVRPPKYYFILYDIGTPSGLLDPIQKRDEGQRVGLEVVPTLYLNRVGHVSPYQKCQSLIDDIRYERLTSILGGPPEGIVLKHHAFVYRGKTTATKLKLVTPDFRESHAMKQHKEQATPETAITAVGQAYSLPARFHKAYQHLRDAGKLKGDDVDFFRIKEELDNDLEREAREEVTAYLWAELAPYVKRACRTGFDEWYKQKLAEPKPSDA